MSTPPGSGDSTAWQAALALTEELLELPEDERDAALSQSGASPEALALARLMLAAAPMDSVLDTPLSSLLDDDEDQVDTLVGRRLGRWLLTGLLGQGGMSVVYRARSLSPPVGQEAALKLLSLAAATPEGRARFEREIDILVRLRHPGIAPVFDAGVADDGTPWFAMALVEGQDIATWCREQGLDVAARVDLMLQVCDAVEHAHRHLVIHRDIKPSNVLVDGEGRAILLDFGISRMLEEGATEITTAGTYAFTPRYAAPEQLRGGAVTTATDVYSLGSVLHMLVVGRPPQFVDEVADGECRNPASLVGRDGDGSLRRMLSGDLGEILKKALARDSGRRYPGVSELAADLRAWRSGRPVAARRGGSGYRFRRLVMRHKLATGLVVALVASLAAGIIGFAWQAGHARQQAARATQEAEHARLAAEAANAQTEFLRELLRAFTPSNTELASLDRDTILQEAVKRAERRLEGYPDVLARVKLQVADTYMIMQKYEQAGVLLEQAAADLDGLEGDHHQLGGRIHLARANSISRMSSRPENQEAALTHYRAALSLLDPVRDTDEWRMAKRHYSAFLLRQGRPDEGLREVEEGAAGCEPGSADFECIMLLRQRASTLQSLSRPAESLPLYEQAVESLQAHFPENEHLLFRVWIELARVYTQSGRYDDAQRMYSQALEVHGRLHGSPTTASIRALSGRAKALLRLGRSDEALASASEALAQAEATLGKDSTEVANRAEDLAQVYAAMGNLPKAIELNKRGLDILRRVLGSGDHLNIAVLQGRRATLLDSAGDPARALPLHRSANESMARTLGTESRRYALRMSSTARTEHALGMLGDARTHFDESLRIYRKLAVENDYAPPYILANRALVRLAQGEREQARADAMEGLHGVVAATRESDARAMRALLWALQMHCAAPASQDCEALVDTATRILASGESLPPPEKRKLEAFLAER